MGAGHVIDFDDDDDDDDDISGMGMGNDKKQDELEGEGWSMGGRSNNPHPRPDKSFHAGSLNCGNDRDPASLSLLQIFMLFMPMAFLGLLCTATTAKAARLGKGWGHALTIGFFFKWIGLTMLMQTYPVDGGQEQYWEDELIGPTFKRVMSSSRWIEIKECLCIPTYGPEDAEYFENDFFHGVRRWLDVCKLAFAAAYTIGSLFVGDESMSKWTHNCQGVFYEPRKPIPLGFLWRTACDGCSGVMTFFELCEGKAKPDRYGNMHDGEMRKEFATEHKPHTAQSLRMVSWLRGTAGAARTIILDAGYGSVGTLRALYKRGWYAVVNIKNCHKLFPRKFLLSKLIKRDDRVAMTTVKDGCPILAAGHMDKQPMLLAATYGTDQEGPIQDRIRHKLGNDGIMHSKRFKLPQPHVHWIYRNKFNMIDLFNKTRHASNGIEFVVHTKSYIFHLFIIVLNFARVNVTKVWQQYHPKPRRRPTSEAGA